MDFSLHLHTCNLGTQVRKGKNPFTGEVVEFPIDPGLTSAERSAVRALLKEAGASEPDPDNYRRVTFKDKSTVNVAAGALDRKEPCVAFAVECSALTLKVVSLIHDLACKGNMSIGSTVDPAVVALPLADQAKKVSKRWPGASVVESPSQLEFWLRQQIDKGTIV